MAQNHLDALLIESCNFTDFPTGGQLSFAKQLMSVFGNRLGLVGVSTDDTPTGKWLRKTFNGTEYWYFSYGRISSSSKKPLIPSRLRSYLTIKKHRKAILSKGVDNVLIQAPEIMIAVSNWGWRSICYSFAGVENPLSMPRYRWGRLLAHIFDNNLFKSLQRADAILARADSNAIEELISRSNGLLNRETITQFPTKVDTSVFYPIAAKEARAELGIEQDELIITNCGRLNYVKGWEFILSAFREFIKLHEHSKLYFVGDGEDRLHLESMIGRYGLDGHVCITGFQPTPKVVCYLNASDLCVIGSYREGWSIAMLEALACGKAIVTTEVSGSHDMVVDGKNGFVVKERDPQKFANAMQQALMLSEVRPVSLSIAEKYALKNLARDLGAVWKPLS